MENFQNELGLKGFKWTSLNAPGTETPLSHPILELGEFPFLTIGPLLLGYKKWLPSMKVEKYENF